MNRLTRQQQEDVGKWICVGGLNSKSDVEPDVKECSWEDLAAELKSEREGFDSVAIADIADGLREAFKNWSY